MSIIALPNRIPNKSQWRYGPAKDALEAGADPHARDKFGRNALSHACAGKGDIEAVKFLRGLGVDHSRLRGVIERAKKYNQKTTLDFFRAAGLLEEEE